MGGIIKKCILTLIYHGCTEHYAGYYAEEILNWVHQNFYVVQHLRNMLFTILKVYYVVPDAGMFTSFTILVVWLQHF